jgi:hypothetical protein
VPRGWVRRHRRLDRVSSLWNGIFYRAGPGDEADRTSGDGRTRPGDLSVRYSKLTRSGGRRKPMAPDPEGLPLLGRIDQQTSGDAMLRLGTSAGPRCT